MSANPQTADPSLSGHRCTGGFRPLCIEAAFPQRFNPHIRGAGSSPRYSHGTSALTKTPEMDQAASALPVSSPVKAASGTTPVPPCCRRSWAQKPLLGTGPALPRWRTPEQSNLL